MKKTNIIFRRLLQMIPVLLGIAIITFILAQATPGDPMRLILGPRASEEAIAAARARYGLDKPILVQFFIYLRNLLQGDWGRSLAFRTPVLELMRSRFPPTLYLLFGSLVLLLIPTVVLAVLASWRQDSWLDQAIRFFGALGLGVPSFWIALILALVFAVRLNWFPATGFGETFSEHVRHLILPWSTIIVAMTPILVRNLRATLLEKKGADFVTAARSKGLPEQYVFMRHVFPNSILPSLQLLGIIVLYILGTAVIVEPIFAIPGLGQLLIRSIIARDYFVVQGLTLVFAVITILATLAVDILSMIIDPRIE